MIEEIKTAIHTAVRTKQKIAMFHFQVLKNAKELEGMNPEAFCREVDVPATYQTEFRKMLGLKGMGLMAGKSIEIGSDNPDELRSAKMLRDVLNSSML